MKLRTGRRNEANIYVQLGDEPSNDDPCIGFVPDHRVARWIVAEMTGEKGAFRRLEVFIGVCGEK